MYILSTEDDEFLWHDNDLLDFYDTERGFPIENLVINLGSDDLPRISCASHKLNLVLRGAFVQHKVICQHLKSLNRFIRRIRKSYKLSRIFKDLKVRLRLENKTRWGSAYISLITIKRAYKCKAIKEDDLPVDISVIDVYIKILSPAYLFNLDLQSNKSSIAYVIPSILRVTYKFS